MALRWTNLNLLHPRMFCAKFGRNWPSDSWVNFLNLNFVNVLFVIICPRKSVGQFLWMHLNSLHPRMFIPKLVEIYSVVLEKILDFVNEFPLFLFNIPFKKCKSLHLNKLEFPSPKNTLCQVWLKLAKRFCRRI